MLSMETLPIKPVKKSSSVMLEFMSRRAGRRVSIRVNLGRQTFLFTKLRSTHVKLSSNLPKYLHNISVYPLKLWKINTVKEVLL